MSEALPEGLRLALEALTPAEEASLIALIESEALVSSPLDPENDRSSISFGWKYDYPNDSFVPCRAVPEEFGKLYATAAAFAGVNPEDFAECLVNRYGPGAIIQPHRDKPVWDLVLGISLGAQTTMMFDHIDRGERFAVALPARSMYLMSGPARYEYNHSLPGVTATRWSITLRRFSPEGLALRARYETAA